MTRTRLETLLVAGLVLTGLSMRTAVTSVGAVLDDVQDGLHVGGAGAGVITTLPVLCFAGLGALTPRWAARVGPHALLVAGLATATVGLALRVLLTSFATFVIFSVLALAGGAVSNVLLPSLVKTHFPDRVATMTAVYTTALAVGTTLAAGLTVPVGRIGDGWRTGLGSWALLAGVAVLPWLPTVRADRADRRERASAGGAPRAASMGGLRRSPTAWTLTAFFAFQSLQAYIAFGWLADYLHAHGITMSTAGWMVALFSATSIPISMIAPRLAAGRPAAVILALAACSLVAYAGLAAAPRGGAWVWMVLAGAGSGTFPVALTLIGLQARTPGTTAALSAFVQTIGYVVAGSGPLLFGVLHESTGAWALPMALLFAALGIMTVAGVRAARSRYVDDELVGPAPGVELSRG